MPDLKDIIYFVGLIVTLVSGFFGLKYGLKETK